MSQNNSLIKFFAEAFFNSPNFDHGIKAVYLTNLIVSRLTHYIELKTPFSKMRVDDLIALADLETYSELFT